MDFGRSEPGVALDALDLDLPPDHPEAPAFFAARGHVERKTGAARGGQRVFIGAPIWNHAGYVGKLYPPGTRPDRFLHHYSRQFSTIELNTTYYGADPARLAKWREQTPPGFLFCPKFPREIGHDKRLAGVEDATAGFCETCRALGDRLGPLWILLPPDFGPAELDRLAVFLRDVPEDLELAVEVRHPAWFSDAGAASRLFALLEGVGAAAVLTDTVGRRDVLHMRPTANFAFVRFSGNGLHSSDYARMDAWILRLGRWLERGLERAFLFLHQPEPQEDQTAELGVYAVRRLRELVGVEAKGPELQPPPPQEQSLFGEEQLFRNTSDQ